MRPPLRSETLGHKRECHRCPYNGKGSNECLRCIGPADNSYKGINYVHLDEQPDPNGILESRMNKRDQGEGYIDEFIGRSALPDTVEEALVPIIATFFQLSDQELIVIKHKYNGEDDVEVSKAIGVTKQRVNAIVHAICNKIPRMAMVIQAMRRLGIGGAKRRKRNVAYVQGDLFGQDDGEGDVA